MAVVERDIGATTNPLGKRVRTKELRERVLSAYEPTEFSRTVMEANRRILAYSGPSAEDFNKSLAVSSNWLTLEGFKRSLDRRKISYSQGQLVNTLDLLVEEGVLIKNTITPSYMGAQTLRFAYRLAGEIQA